MTIFPSFPVCPLHGRPSFSPGVTAPFNGRCQFLPTTLATFLAHQASDAGKSRRARFSLQYSEAKKG